ncbi:MAG TPA: SURF1 family protein [Burkholderiaceae bacterium]|jgi:surfeit locus 1 family protein
MPLSPRGRAAVILAATLAGTVLTANLGAWQLRRAAQKIALQDALDGRAKQPAIAQRELAATAGQALEQQYRPVQLRGHWVPERTVFLENRQMRARVGFYVVTPLQLSDRPEAILVQRGWVPRDQRDRTLLPAVPTPAGEVEVDGHLGPPPSKLYDFGGAERGLIRQNIELDAFKTESGLRLAPLSVQQSDSPSTAGDGLLRDWPRPAVDVQMHYGYAFQWFAMCALMAGLYVWFQLVRPRLRRPA